MDSSRARPAKHFDGFSRAHVTEMPRFAGRLRDEKIACGDRRFGKRRIPLDAEDVGDRTFVHQGTVERRIVTVRKERLRQIGDEPRGVIQRFERRGRRPVVGKRDRARGGHLAQAGDRTAFQA